MTIREHKRILMFLEDLLGILENQKGEFDLDHLLSLYTDSELREIVYWNFKDSWSKNALGFLQRSELIELIQTDHQVLSWTIHHLEEQLKAQLTYSQDEVNAFFNKTQNEAHYLAHKPVEQWDEYDLSNYRSLMFKTGTAKKVYGIFDSDVLAEDASAVTTQPKFFFDTKVEAEEELERIIAEGEFSREELTIHHLWKLNS